MSAFDATVRVGEASVQVLQENEDTPAHEAQLVLGLMAVAPVGPGQALPIPFGAIRVPLDKDSIDALIEQLTEASSRMKARPNIQVASSLDGVDQAAKFQQGLR